MESAEFDYVDIERSDDWVNCWIDGGVETRTLEWQGRGGDRNLVEMLDRFRAWVESVR